MCAYYIYSRSTLKKLVPRFKGGKSSHSRSEILDGLLTVPSTGKKRKYEFISIPMVII